MPIKQSAIDTVARAMARALHASPEELPERDVERQREPAKLFLAALLAAADLRPTGILEGEDAAPVADTAGPTDTASEAAGDETNG